MSVADSNDGKKWINALLVVAGILVGYISISFFEQLSEWFDLEAKVQSFAVYKQLLGLALGVTTFVVLYTNSRTMQHLNEVYYELKKVVWPEKNTVLKLTVGIIIAVSIVSSIFVFIDFVFQKLLELLY